MLIKPLPDFDLIGDASTPAEMVDWIKTAALVDEAVDHSNARLAMLRDAKTIAWYGAAVRETMHELTHANGDQLLP